MTGFTAGRAGGAPEDATGSTEGRAGRAHESVTGVACDASDEVI